VIDIHEFDPAGVDANSVAAQVSIRPGFISIRFDDDVSLRASSAAARNGLAQGEAVILPVASKPPTLANHIGSSRPVKLQLKPVRSSKPSRASDIVTAAAEPSGERDQLPVAAMMVDEHVTRPWAARLSHRYVSVTEAAAESGLPRGVISGWAEQKLVQNLKTGVGNSKRVVRLGDVLRLRDQRVAPSMPRTLAPGCRVLLYTRIDGDGEGNDEEDALELERADECFYAQVMQRHPDAAQWRTYRCAEIGRQADLNRPGFVQLMAMILARKIDLLVVADTEQLCSAGCLPLLLWLLTNNHITLQLQTPPQPPSPLHQESTGELD